MAFICLNAPRAISRNPIQDVQDAHLQRGYSIPGDIDQFPPVTVSSEWRISTRRLAALTPD